MSVLQTVQKNNRQFTYGQTVQKNNKQFTYGQTVQKNNKQFTYGQTVQKNCTGAFTVLQTVQKTTTAIYIWTDSAKKNNNSNLHMDRQCKKQQQQQFTYGQTVQKKQQQFTYRQYIFTDCTEDNVQNTHTFYYINLYTYIYTLILYIVTPCAFSAFFVWIYVKTFLFICIY